MSRIRTIKPEFWTSEQVMRCSMMTRLLFIGLWNFSDDHGIHPASCVRLKAELFPADTCPLSDVEQCIAELIKQELIEEYEVDGNTYWIITGWKKHQKIDKPTYRHPLPLTPRNSTSIRRILVEPSDTERNGMESNGMETKGMDNTYVDNQKNNALKAVTTSCPHAAIIALYHDILPACRQIRRWTKTRNQHLQQRWREDVKHQSLEFWKKYFEHVSQSDFLTGKIRQSNRAPFIADFEWLIKPANFTNVIEGKYHGGLS